MVRTQIYLPKSQLDLLKEKALEKGVTVSEMIRQIIDENINNTESTKKYQNDGDFLLSIAEKSKKYKRDTNYPKDLSQNLDKYLYGDESI